MVGYKDYRIQGNENDAEWNLSHLADNKGYGLDFYDPLYHYDWNKELGFNTISYWKDCDTGNWESLPNGMTSGASYYPYKSKVCVIGWSTWVTWAHQEPIGRMAQALDGLHLYHNPDQQIYSEYPYTPRQVARWVEGSYWISGVGVKGFYTPFGSWPGDYASSVRSAEFLALEAILGYKYGDTTSQSYADQMADIFTKTMGSGGIQIPSTGVIQIEESPNTITRKHWVGAWPTAWNSLKAVAPRGALQQIGDLIQEGTLMRKEFAGVIVSNAESIDTIMRSLMVYLEFKYPTGVYIRQARATYFAETEFFNTGNTRMDRSNYFSSTATRTLYVWSRNFGDPYARYVRLFIDGVQKAEWVCGSGYSTCYNSWTGSISAGTRNIGIVTTTYDTGTPDSWWVQTVFTTSGGIAALGLEDRVILPGDAKVLTLEEQAALIAQNATLPVVMPGG
jgi:hypothetical protein